MWRCEFCELPMEGNRRGRPRRFHPECGEAARAMTRLEKACKQAAEARAGEGHKPRQVWSKSIGRWMHTVNVHRNVKR